MLYRRVVLSVLIVAAASPILGQWASLGGDFQRAGLSRHAGPTQGCTIWKFEPGGAVTGGLTVGSDGRVHVPCENGKLYTLDADGHSEHWRWHGEETILTGRGRGLDQLPGPYQLPSPEDKEDVRRLQIAVWGRLGY